MNLVVDTSVGSTDPAHWSGSGGIPVRLAEHLSTQRAGPPGRAGHRAPDRGCSSGTPAAAAS